MNVFGWLVALLAGSVSNVLGWVTTLIKDAPDPQIDTVWFRQEYTAVFKIGLYLMVPMVLAATIGLIIRGSLFHVFRTYVLGVGVAVLGGAVSLSVLALCLEINNDLTEAVTKGPLGVQGSMDQFLLALQNMQVGFTDEGIIMALGQAGTPLFFIIILNLLLIFALFLWVELIFRQVMLYVAILFLPLAFVAYVWGPIRIWLYMLAEICVTMIFAKFIIAVTAGFGLRAVFAFAGDGSSGTIQTADTSMSLMWLFGGLLVMFVACFAVPAVIAFVMQPTHDILRRKQVTSMSPWSSRSAYGYSLMKGAMGAFKKK